MTPIICARPSPPRGRSPSSPTTRHVRSNIRSTSISMPSAISWNAASQNSSSSAASQPASKRPPEITAPSSLSPPSSYGCDKCPHHLVRAKTVPDEAKPRQEQQAEHDVAKMLVAQRVIDAGAGPCADQRARKRDQREPDHLQRDETRGCLQHQRSREHGEIEELEDAASLMLVPAADVGPQNRQRPRQSRKAAQNAAGKAD